jgi:hypothetical protein
MYHATRSILPVLLGTAMLIVSTLAGVSSAAAQAGTPEATPVSEPSCTADLGIVRSTKTCVTVVHAAQDAPTMDIYVNGQVVVDALGYATSSGFASIPAGTYEVQIAPVGMGQESALVELPSVELVAGRAYEIAVLGSGSTIEAKVLEVNVYGVEGTSRAGSTRVRLINASADFVSANLDLIGGDIATRVFRGVDLAGVSDYAVVAAGTYEARLTESVGGEEIPYVPNFSVGLERDTVTSIYIIGARSSDTITILSVTTQASRLPAPATPAASPAA